MLASRGIKAYRWWPLARTCFPTLSLWTALWTGGLNYCDPFWLGGAWESRHQRAASLDSDDSAELDVAGIILITFCSFLQREPSSCCWSWSGSWVARNLSQVAQGRTRTGNLSITGYKHTLQQIQRCQLAFRGKKKNIWPMEGMQTPHTQNGGRIGTYDPVSVSHRRPLPL